MEKYRQFEDVTNGINPFIVAKKKTKSSSLLKILLRYINTFISYF